MSGSPPFVDLRYEDDASSPMAPEAGMMRVPSQAGARVSGDLELIGAYAQPACLTWVPGTPPVVIDRLANSPDMWWGFVRIVPRDWGGESALLPWLVDDLAAVLADIRRPLMIELDDDEPPWAGIYRIASSYPVLPVVLGAGSRTRIAIAEELCHACPNVLLESSGLGGDDLQQFVHLLGTRRVVYGSGGPACSAHAEAIKVAAACSSEDERRSILSENAQLLLDGSWTV